VTERAQDSAGPASAGPSGDARPKHGAADERPTVVVRDKRRIKIPDADPEPAAPVDEELIEVPDVAADAVQQTAAAAEVAEELVEGEIVAEEPDATQVPGPLGAELEALRAELDERTKDLQRLSAEYANYRKRVDRDRGLVAEQATGAVLAALLPVLDDLDRAREHGDLVGPFSSVAEQLNAATTKFGLTPFGDKGDAFDPTRHEAVAHQTSADVSEPTCVDVLRRGYLLGERLLRPALVAVADPE
jgi:molecular chaperone GrpE